MKHVQGILVVTNRDGSTQVLFSHDSCLMTGKFVVPTTSTLDRIAHLVEDSKVIPTFVYWRQNEAWKPLAQFTFRRA